MEFNQRLLEEAEDRFGFVRGRSKSLESNRSLTYDCQRKRRRFILKVRPFGVRRTDSYTMGELEFLEHLSAHGIRVPRVVPSLGGQLVEVLDTERGPYMAYAYEKVPGKVIDWKEWTPELFQKWGALIGRIHAASKSFKLSHHSYMRKHWYEDEEYDLARHAHFLPPAVLQKGRELLARLLTLPKDNDSYGLVHEDLHQWNFFVHKGALIPIDFEDCQFDWFAGDFSAGLHNAITAHSYYYRTGQYEYWMGGQKMDTPTFIDYFLQHFLEGYNRENWLDTYWLRHIPDFVRRRHLSTYIDRVQAPADARPSDEEHMARWPWRTVSQHAEQVISDDWADAIFEKFLARL